MSIEGTHVFISSCHENSEHSFPSVLDKALQDKKINTFSRNVGEVRDNSTLASMYQEIEESWISIVVLSKKYYASNSQGQLDKILECKKKMNQIVYPIYYEVDLPEVDQPEKSILKGVYKEDMIKLDEIEAGWRSHLAELAQIKSRFIIESQFKTKIGEDAKRIAELVHRSLFGYDVFISFKGQDTGYTFTSNLSNALRQNKIKTFFVNDDELKKKEISSSFRKAIKESRISIVVLSQSYAESTWCLNELNTIIQGKDENHFVWPIFYKVEPSVVRAQRDDYKAAMDEHKKKNCPEVLELEKNAVDEHKKKICPEVLELEKKAIDEHKKKNCPEVREWEKNLTEVANLTGLTIETGYEYKHIEKIVESTVQSLSKYDVFLSFSREDTGNSFARYLYNVLCQSGFKTFMDVVGIGNRDQISDTVKKAIENSKNSIIIFSKNYAYSDWCLNEVVEIFKCRENKNHMIWPVLYNVELEQVRFLTTKDGNRHQNSYACAISAHKDKYPEESVEKWESALRDVTWHGGYTKVPKSKSDFVKAENDAELIQKILEHLNVPDRKLWPVPVENSETHPFLSTGGFSVSNATE